MGLDALAQYSPWLVLLVGLATYLGYVGVGLAVQGALRIRLPSPWKQLVAVAIGIGVVSLAVQVAGMMWLASRAVLITIWAAAVLCGVAFVRQIGPLRPPPTDDDPGILPTVFVCLACAVILLVAVAPSTKIDELFYHMLVPSRLVADAAMKFYLQPWTGAIMPQMIYQIAAAPLHAMNLRDASNITSWCAAVTLAWMAWYLVAEATGRRGWAAVVALSLIVGMYPVAHYSAAGTHASGDLLSAALVLAVLSALGLRARIGAGHTAFVVGVLAAAGISMKVSLGPVAALCMLAAGVQLTYRADHRELVRVLAGLLLPGLVLCVPLMTWTWAVSGSPLGPMLAGRFGHSVYEGGIVQRQMAETFGINAAPLSEVAKELVIDATPLLWIGVLACLVYPAVPAAVRVFALVLLGLQATLIWVFLTHSTRFLGGIPHALWITAAMMAGPAVLRTASSRVGVTLLLTVFVLPWIAVEYYYAVQFIPQLAGGARRERFVTEKVALIEDYKTLDRILPADAALLIIDPIRVSMVYAPRPIFTAPADVPVDKPCYLLKFDDTSGKPEQYPLVDWRRGETVYANERAVIATFRTPGHSPQLGPIRVQKIERDHHLHDDAEMQMK